MSSIEFHSVPLQFWSIRSYASNLASEWRIESTEVEDAAVFCESLSSSASSLSVWHWDNHSWTSKDAPSTWSSKGSTSFSVYVFCDLWPHDIPGSFCGEPQSRSEMGLASMCLNVWDVLGDAWPVREGTLEEQLSCLWVSGSSTIAWVSCFGRLLIFMSWEKILPMQFCPKRDSIEMAAGMR